MSLVVSRRLSTWGRVGGAVLALALLVSASQAQWWTIETANLLSITPRQVRLVWVAAAIVLLVASRSTVRSFPVPSPPRPRYSRAAVVGVIGCGLLGRMLIAPLAGDAVGYLFDVAERDYDGRFRRSFLWVFVDDVVAPALWEELLWRVVVLAVLLRLTGPRIAVTLQAVSFAVAHTSLSVGFGQISHSVRYEYLFDVALEVALSGIVFGFLVVELGMVWPAVVVHAISNVASVYRETVPWLSILVASASAGLAVGTIGLTRREVLPRLAAWLRPCRGRQHDLAAEPGRLPTP